MGLALADQVQDAVGAYKKLCGGDTGYASATGNQALADDSLQGACQLDAYLVLALRRAGVDDTLHGLGRAGGMQVDSTR